MAESLETVSSFVEVRAVTVECGSFVAELYLAVENLCITIDPLVVVQHVGMYKIDALILLLRGSARALLLLSGESGGSEEQKQQDCGNAAAQPT
jgi:hypothetical protein